MGIFIRSQNKRRLIEANIFDIYVADEGVRIEASTEKHTYFLGTYSTEEKTLKVLDMIQEHISGQTTLEEFDLPFYTIQEVKEKLNKSIIFQMPQDEEVK